LIGAGFALAEWRLARKQNPLPGENHD
jgi:hypothetical protein